MKFDSLFIILISIKLFKRMVFYPQKMWIKALIVGLSIRKMKEKVQ